MPLGLPPLMVVIHSACGRRTSRLQPSVCLTQLSWRCLRRPSGHTTAAAFVAESPTANLLHALAAAAPDSFSSQLFTTPFSTTDPTLLSAEPSDFANDFPLLRQAAASEDRDEWESACVDELRNLRAAPIRARLLGREANNPKTMDKSYHADTHAVRG